MAIFIGQGIEIKQPSHCTRDTTVIIGTCLHGTSRERAECDVSGFVGDTYRKFVRVNSKPRVMGKNEKDGREKGGAVRQQAWGY